MSEDGTRQDNIVHTAIQQLAKAFVPYTLMSAFRYNLDFTNVAGDPVKFFPWVTATIPVIITNAKIYRLKPGVSDLDVIRKAGAPDEIADELSRTWCYFEPPVSLVDQNIAAIEARKHEAKEFIYRFPAVEERLESFDNRPNWLAIINIRSLPDVVASLTQHFLSLPTLPIERPLGKRVRKSRKEPGR